MVATMERQMQRTNGTQRTTDTVGTYAQSDIRELINQGLSPQAAAEITSKSIYAKLGLEYSAKRNAQIEKVNELEEEVEKAKANIFPSKLGMIASATVLLASIAAPIYSAMTHKDQLTLGLSMVGLYGGAASAVGTIYNAINYGRKLPQLVYKKSQLRRAKKELSKLERTQ